MSEPIWFPKREAALQARIKELEKECAQWQESSGQNYVRAQEAEAREETLRSEVERLRETVQSPRK
jgi:erythromycin esterase-like protein